MLVRSRARYIDLQSRTTCTSMLNEHVTYNDRGCLLGTTLHRSRGTRAKFTEIGDRWGGTGTIKFTLWQCVEEKLSRSRYSADGHVCRSGVHVRGYSLKGHLVTLGC